MQAYQAGFIAGAKKANPAVEVKSIYTGSFTDQQKGYEAGKALIEQGADIVFAAAGQTGLGTAKACQENKALFIGVDSDQFLTIPAIGDTIITSAIKKIDVAVFETIKKAVDGTLKGGVNEAARHQGRRRRTRAVPRLGLQGPCRDQGAGRRCQGRDRRRYRHRSEQVVCVSDSLVSR